MKRVSLIFVVTAILVYAGCKKTQPIPDKLNGFWKEVKTVNAATQVTLTNLSGNCLHFSDKAWSLTCRGGSISGGKRYEFTPDANDPTKGTLIFKGRKMDPDTYSISFSGDTLILNPPSPVYDVKYYLPD